MKNISDERLEEMLTEYCEADSEQSFVYDPDRKREKVIPFARINRITATAAGLVFVSVLSLIVYFSLGNKIGTPIAVAPSHQGAITPSAPVEGSGGDSPEQSDEGGNNAPTESRSGLLRFFEDLTRQPTESDSSAAKDHTTDPTTPSFIDRLKLFLTPKATEKPSVDPTEKTPFPTEKKPSSTEIVPPTEKKPSPTEQIHEPPQPTVPHDPPSIDPTESGPETPTHPDEGSSPGDEPGYEPPTEGGGMMETPPPDIYAYIDSSLLDDNTHVYCKIYNGSGKRLGSADLYDGTHSVFVSAISGRRTQLVYEIPDDLITQMDYYLFVFYDDSGRMLTQVQQYID